MSLAQFFDEPIDVPTSGQRVLVVDDDPGHRELVVEALRCQGYVVEQAMDGASALTVLAACEPDIIVSDLRLPNTDGLTLLQRVRHSTAKPDIPFIMLTGSERGDDAVRSLNHGANDCLRKPVDPSELEARLRQQLRYTCQMRHLRAQTFVDSLTTVFNRRGALAALDREIERSHRSEKPLAVLVIDVDKFKYINDTYGHQAGDCVLRGLAAALTSAVRASDIVGRIGGDEFVVVLPECDQSQVGRIVSRIREHSAEVFVANTSKSISVSIGCSYLCDGAESVAALLEQADRAMYRDKRVRRRPCLQLL